MNATLNATSYLWLFGDGESSIEENPVHEYTPGTYDVKLTAWNECVIDSNYEIGINIIGTSTSGTSADRQFSIYPNPTTGQFRINFKHSIESETDIQIYSSLGNLVFEKKKIGEDEEIDLLDQPEGVYVLLLTIGAKQYSQKLILQK
jgi:PKD repeat protein